MFKITIILLCGVSLLVSGDADSVVPESTQSSVGIVTGITLDPVENKTTTIEPPKPPQPPTPPPTTPKPTPPTTKPTTTAPPTTPKPTPPTTKPTTTAPPTTTIKPHPPGPLPEPTPGKWQINDTKQVCLIAQMAIQVHVDFVKDNVTMKTAFNVPVDNETVTASGFCGPSEQNLTLTWPCDKNITGQGNDSLTLHFVKNDTQKHYSLHHLEIILAPHHFFNSSAPLKLVHNAQQFSTGLANSYRCFKSQKLNLTLDEKLNDTVGYLKVSELQFQAFRTDNNTAFGLAEDCAFDTPDIVPIVVGCALAALVVIVLIAYLVGRRRRNAQGYSSM